jgi:dTDP-4-dehydrorhamnose reductase
LARVPAGGEVFHLTGSTSLSPFDLGRKIAEAWNLDASLARPSSLGDYLKRDPRPRQRSLRMDNAKWSDFARRHGLSAPLDIDAGLRHVVAGLSASSS